MGFGGAGRGKVGYVCAKVGGFIFARDHSLGVDIYLLETIPWEFHPCQ